jgi:divalent metal cation (Fe/Co/Zn/Cd) transporter
LARGRTITSAYREVTRAVLLGLGINLCLGLAKLIGGLVGHSFALLSDAVNSLGAVVSRKSGQLV